MSPGLFVLLMIALSADKDGQRSAQATNSHGQRSLRTGLGQLVRIA